MQVIQNIIDDTHGREGMEAAFPTVYDSEKDIVENAKEILKFINGWAVVCNGIIALKPYETNQT